MEKWPDINDSAERESTPEEAKVEEAPDEVEEVAHDMEAPAAMREYAAEQEREVDAQLELLREFQNEEEEAFRDVSERGTREQRSFTEALKKVTASAALVMALWSGGKAYAEQFSQPEHETQKQELVVGISEEAVEKMNEWGWRMDGGKVATGEHGLYFLDSPDTSGVREIEKVDVFDVGDDIFFIVKCNDGTRMDFRGSKDQGIQFNSEYNNHYDRSK